MDIINFNQQSKIPIWLNDFSRMQDTYVNALKGILKSLDPDGDANFVVSGCQITSYTQTLFQISAGYVWIAGNLHKVVQSTFLKSTDSPVLRVVITNNSSGDRINANNVTVQPWQDTEAVVIAQASLNPGEAYCSVYGATLLSRINDLIVPSWIDAGTLSNGWTSQNTNLFQYRGNNGQVQFRGGIGGGSYGNNIFRLPNGYRPERLVQLPLIVSHTSNFNYMLHIDTEGYVKIYSDDNAQQDFYINVSFNL